MFVFYQIVNINLRITNSKFIAVNTFCFLNFQRKTYVLPDKSYIRLDKFYYRQTMDLDKFYYRKTEGFNYSFINI